MVDVEFCEFCTWTLLLEHCFQMKLIIEGLEGPYDSLGSGFCKQQDICDCASDWYSHMWSCPWENGTIMRLYKGLGSFGKKCRHQDIGDVCCVH